MHNEIALLVLLLLTPAVRRSLQVIPPVKNAEFKITLATNRDAVQLVALFGDLLVQVRCSLGCIQPATIA